MSRPDPRKSRGYRNRNPGNIEHSPANKWLGLADPPSDGRFCRFVSHEHGIRALAVLLQAYQDRHGLRTVRAIISRFAPGHENPTEAYVTAVARRMGVGREAAIDVHAPATTLGGAVEWAQPDSPSFDDIDIDGAASVRAASVPVSLWFTTGETPLS
jgi:hypothetical protein